MDGSSLPKQWLAFRLGHLGDVALCTGVLSWLARTKGWSFSFVTRQAFAGIFAGNPHVRSVIALEEEDLGPAAFARLAGRLAREHQGQGLLDLHGSPRSRVLSLRWRGPVLRAPKMSLERRLFLASKRRFCGEELRAATVTQRYCLAVESTAPPASELLPRIWISEEERDWARRRLDELVGPGISPVALHPFATHALKAWPGEHWRELAARLDRAHQPWIALGKGQPLFPGRSVDLANATSLRETCALLSLCRVLITGDSGPMHLAQAVGTPVIALFGPTTKEWGFFPAGPHDVVLEKLLPCRPCSLHGKKPCPRAGECLGTLGPEEVFRTIEQTCAKR